MKTICTLLAFSFPAVTQAALFSISGTATPVVDTGLSQFAIGTSFPYEIIFDDTVPDTDPGADQSYEAAITSLSINGESVMSGGSNFINIPAPGNANLTFTYLISGFLDGSLVTIQGDFARPTGESNPPDFQLTDFGALSPSDFGTPPGNILIVGGGTVVAPVDTITISPVPEPSTPALILLGTLALLRRRAR